MSGSLREALPSDADALEPLLREYYAGEGYPWDDGVVAAARRLLADPSLGRIWLVEADGVPVGYLVLALGYSLEYRGRDAFVDELYLRPEWRARGLGRQLLETAIAACRDLGVGSLHLEVERGNDRAHRLYRRLGFVDHDRHLLTRPIRG